MPNSFSVVTTNLMELTPVRVTYNGVDLGGTLGNAKIKFETKKADIKADQSGDTIRDRRFSGFNVTVETELTQVQNKDIWKVVFPSQKEIISGGNKAIQFLNEIGKGDLAQSHNLLLHPLSRADADLNGDFLFYKAVADEKSEIVHGPSEQVKLKVLWNIYPDDSVQPERFLFHGDPSIGIVNASAASPTYTGTGNGLMSAVTVYNGYTLSETITATCIQTAVNGGKFLVQGSISGVLGLATVGTTFVSPYISFLISDGSTDFVNNDAFSIVTTAANYA